MSIYDVDYGKREDLEKELLYKRIVEWNEDKLTLDDGTVVTIECSESDCCAWAGGSFSNVELDAMITNVEFGESVEIPDYDTCIHTARVTLFHNQNPIAQADVTADAGNGGYYYSVGSFVVKGVHYPIVRA